MAPGAAAAGVALTGGDIDAPLDGDSDLGQIAVQGFAARQIPLRVPPPLEGTLPGAEPSFPDEFIERNNDFDEAKTARQAGTDKLR